MLLEHDDIEFVEEQETGSDESMAFPLAPLKHNDLNVHGFPLLFEQQRHSSIVRSSQILGCSVCLHREACDRGLTCDTVRFSKSGTLLLVWELVTSFLLPCKVYIP